MVACEERGEGGQGGKEDHYRVVTPCGLSTHACRARGGQHRPRGFGPISGAEGIGPCLGLGGDRIGQNRGDIIQHMLLEVPGGLPRLAQSPKSGLKEAVQGLRDGQSANDAKVFALGGPAPRQDLSSYRPRGEPSSNQWVGLCAEGQCAV